MRPPITIYFVCFLDIITVLKALSTTGVIHVIPIRSGDKSLIRLSSEDITSESAKASMIDTRCP